MVFPNILTVHNACEKHLVFREAVLFNKFCGFDALDKVKTYAVKGKGADIVIAITNVAEICLEEYFCTALFIQYLCIDILEECDILGGHILYKARLVKLNPLCAKG